MGPKASDLRGMDAFIFKILEKIIKNERTRKDFLADFDRFDIDHLNGIINCLSVLK